MISTIHSERIKENLTGKIIDLRKYKYIEYKIYQYQNNEDQNNEDKNLELNIKPLIELIQILKELGYIWGNGLGLHINNFSELTDQGKINRELLKTHTYIVFEDKNHINLVYNWRGYVDLSKSEIISIEDVIEYYWKYRTEKIGINIIPDYRDIMIGDYINLKTNTILEVTGAIYERNNSYSPSKFNIRRIKKMEIEPEIIDEYMINYLELKDILHSEDLESITRVFQGKTIYKYRKEI